MPDLSESRSLDLAFIQKNPRIIQSLIEAKADPNRVSIDEYGNAIATWHQYAFIGDVETFKLLLSSPLIDLNIKALGQFVIEDFLRPEKNPELKQFYIQSLIISEISIKFFPLPFAFLELGKNSNDEEEALTQGFEQIEKVAQEAHSILESLKDRLGNASKYEQILKVIERQVYIVSEKLQELLREDDSDDEDSEDLAQNALGATKAALEALVQSYKDLLSGDSFRHRQILEMIQKKKVGVLF